MGDVVAFVLTAGQVQSVSRVTSGAYGHTSVQLSPTLNMTYEQLWLSQPSIRTVAEFLARNVAQLGLDPYRRISSTDRVKATDHPLARLLARPMQGTPWTKNRLLHALMQDLCIFGNAYWLKISINRNVTGILPIPPWMMAPEDGSWYAASRYRLTGTGGYVLIPADRVVHFHGYNPADPWLGASPIETLRQILAEEHAASTYREQMWRNGARFAGYITRPREAPRWSTEGRDRFRREWQAQYTGNGPEAGGTPILDDGMTFANAGVTPRDAQYIEARKLTREEVAVAYHVSPVMLGLMDGATFSNVTELHKMLYQDTLAPYLAQIAQDIENQLLVDLDPSSVDGSVYVEFNLAEKLRGSFEQQAAAMSTAVGGPWMTRDEGRAIFNLPHIDGAQDLIVPLNVTAGGLASPRDTAPTNPDNGPSNGQPPKARRPAGKAARLIRPAPGPITVAARRFFERQSRAVVARVGATGSSIGDVFDAARWSAELASDLTAPSVDVAARAGRALLRSLGLDDGVYDPDRTHAWVSAHAAAVSDLVNGALRDALAVALTDDAPVGAVRDVFAGYISDRAAELGSGETTRMAGFGAVEAIDQAGAAARKTWVTGDSARPTHAAIDGETVAHGSPFSTGARWPGDTVDPDGVGCNCDMDLELTP